MPRAEIERILSDLATRNERTLQPVLQRWFVFMRGKILRDLSAKFKKDITSELTDWEFIEGQGIRNIKPAALKIMQSGGNAAYKHLAIAGSFDILNVNAIKAADKFTAKLVVDVTAETKKGIRTFIRHGIKEGMSMPKIAREIRPLVGLTNRQTDSIISFRRILEEKRPDLSVAQVDKKVMIQTNKVHRRRMENIARTETARAQNIGYVQGLEDVGVEETQFQISPGACAEWCVPLDGKKYPISEAGAIIPVHPRCRCAMLPVVGDKTIHEQVSSTPSELKLPKPSLPATEGSGSNIGSVGKLTELSPEFASGKTGADALTFVKGGKKYFAKRMRGDEIIQFQREAAAARAMEKVGLGKYTPKTYLAEGTYDGKKIKVIASEMIEGHQNLSALELSQRYRVLNTIDDVVKERLILQDYLMSAWDRSASNMMVKKGSIKLIDYELAFMEKAPSWSDHTLMQFLGKKIKVPAPDGKSFFLRVHKGSPSKYKFNKKVVQETIDSAKTVKAAIEELNIPNKTKVLWKTIVDERAKSLGEIATVVKMPKPLIPKPRLPKPKVPKPGAVKYNTADEYRNNLLRLESTADVKTSAKINSLTIERKTLDKRVVDLHSKYIGREASANELLANIDAKEAVTKKIALINKKISKLEATQTASRKEMFAALNEERNVSGLLKGSAGQWESTADDILSWIPKGRFSASEQVAIKRLGVVKGKGVDSTIGSIDYSVKKNLITIAGNAPDATFAHEFGHHLADRTKDILKTQNKFFKARTVGEKVEKLPGFRLTGKKDKFESYNPYAGRIYADGDTPELISVGLEHIWKNPILAAKQDPEWFNMVISTLKGIPIQ